MFLSVYNDPVGWSTVHVNVTESEFLHQSDRVRRAEIIQSEEFQTSEEKMMRALISWTSSINNHLDKHDKFSSLFSPKGSFMYTVIVLFVLYF